MGRAAARAREAANTRAEDGGGRPAARAEGQGRSRGAGARWPLDATLPFSSTLSPPPSLDDRVLAQVEELATYTEAQRQRREQRAGSIAGRLMSDFLGGHDDSQPPPEFKVKARHARHRGRAGKVTPDEWASEKGSDSEESADVLNQIHRRLRDLSPTPNRPPRPAAPPFEA